MHSQWLTWSDRIVTACLIFVLMISILVVVDYFIGEYEDRQDIKDIKKFFSDIDKTELIISILKNTDISKYENRNEFTKRKIYDLINAVFYEMLQYEYYEDFRFSFVSDIISDEIQNNIKYQYIEIHFKDYYDIHKNDSRI